MVNMKKHLVYTKSNKSNTLHTLICMTFAHNEHTSDQI